MNLGVFLGKMMRTAEALFRLTVLLIQVTLLFTCFRYETDTPEKLAVLPELIVL